MYNILFIDRGQHVYGALFCFIIMRSIELGCFKLCFWCLWKALNKEGCMGLVP